MTNTQDFYTMERAVRRYNVLVLPASAQWKRFDQMDQAAQHWVLLEVARLKGGR